VVQALLELLLGHAPVADQHLAELHRLHGTTQAGGVDFSANDRGRGHRPGGFATFLIVKSWSLAALATLAAACGHGGAPPADAAGPGPAPTPLVPAPPPPPPEFPAGTVSLRLTHSAPVRFTPSVDGKQIGTIADDTRVTWTQTAKGKGCKRSWVEIAPRGWVCGDALEASDKAPAGTELPRLELGDIVPGIYGKVVEDGAITYRLLTPDDEKREQKDKKRGKSKADGPVSAPGEVEPAADVEVDPTGRKMVPGDPLIGSANVRKYGEVEIAGKVYWHIDPRKNQYLLASSIRQHTPSTIHGIRLGDETGLVLPIAFVWPRGQGQYAWTHGRAIGGGVIRQAPIREAVPVLEIARDAGQKPYAVRIGPAEWIDTSELRLVEAAPPLQVMGKPPTCDTASCPAVMIDLAMSPGERWFDVDLDRQVVVAYEGAVAVYAALISSGARDTATEPGIYRVWKKVSETDMRGLSGEDPYAVATVPWTQFFSPEKGLALHTAYWHDKFGTPRSHGCVNLAPADARWLYFWSDPWVPPGWSMTAGIVEAPGSVVRVRSATDPNPPLRGYAIRVQDARAQAQP
jgi:hypothetical protein